MYRLVFRIEHLIQLLHTPSKEVVLSLKLFVHAHVRGGSEGERSGSGEAEAGKNDLPCL